MIHYYYGYGKGKTTSAIGTGMRCTGAGLRVLFVQFFKDNKSSELLSVPFDIFNSPESISFNPKKDDYLPWINSGLDYIKTSSANVVILDEFGDLYPNYLDKKTMLDILSDDREYIITGHNKVDFLYDIADYVTYFQKEKHPFDKGIKARKGIEF